MSYTDLSLADYFAQFAESEGTDYQLIDVRETDEFANGHLPNAVNIPLSVFEERYGEIGSDSPIVLVCARGSRSAQAAEYMAAQGYTNLFNLTGGTLGYISAGYQVEK